MTVEDKNCLTNAFLFVHSPLAKSIYHCLLLLDHYYTMMAKFSTSNARITFNFFCDQMLAKKRYVQIIWRIHC